MRILVGLGNPVPEYTNTRHNAGKQAVEFFGYRAGVQFEQSTKLSASIARVRGITDTLLVQTNCFMNESGAIVRGVLEYYKEFRTTKIFSELVVLYDDLDIPFGQHKLQFGTGPKVHNGLTSVITHVQSDQFWHGRIGIDARGGERTIPGRDYVLQRFSEPEIMQLQQTVFPELARAIDAKIAEHN